MYAQQWDSWMFKLVLEKAEEPEIKLPTSAGSSKNLQTINAGKGVEKREPSCTVGGNAN